MLALSEAQQPSPRLPFPRKAVKYGKYYKLDSHSKRDFTDNTYFLWKPPNNLASFALSQSTSRDQSKRLLPAVFYAFGFAWKETTTVNTGPIKDFRINADFQPYLVNGLAFISPGYRAVDRPYWYDRDGVKTPEELIHVSPEGHLSLDTTGRTMLDYKVQSSWLEMMTKSIYDIVQCLEHVIGHGRELGVDVHRLAFHGQSAGGSAVNYLTWVYHKWNVKRYTPLGLLLTEPQYDLPVFGTLDVFWKSWLDHSNLTYVNQLLPSQGVQSWEYSWFVGNTFCEDVDHESWKFKHLCNMAWESKVMPLQNSRDLTIADLRDAVRWNNSHPDISGIGKLWYTSQNMLDYQPSNLHLYVSTPIIAKDTGLDHSPMYVEAYARQAARAGVHYTVYYKSFPGMEDGPLGAPQVLAGFPSVGDVGPMLFRSSHGWHPKLAQGIDQLMFMCHVLTGSSECGQEQLQLV
jgi:acetyl esterase/lipase